MLQSLAPHPPSNEELARRAQRGCVASFEELMRRFQAPVLHFLRCRGPLCDAEDLLQDTFCRAFENLHRYRPRWPFAAWLFTIARRVGLNHARRARPVQDAFAIEATRSRDPDPSGFAAREDDRRYLWGMAAQALSEEEVTALWLLYVEEMPTREIATVLGRSRVGVKTMLFRARKRLLPLLETLKPEYLWGRVESKEEASDAGLCRAAVEVDHAG